MTYFDPGSVVWEINSTSKFDAIREVIYSATAFTGLPNMPFWRRPFNPDDPVNTPSGLNVAWPGVSTAFARAVRELRQRGIPFDATQREDTVAPYGGAPVSAR